MEHMLNRLARRHWDHVCVMVGFNEAMARWIVGGSDFCLMPSRFETCRLPRCTRSVMGRCRLHMRPGGLADTIEDGGTGFLFSQFSARSLLAACARAFDIFSNKARLSRAASRRHVASQSGVAYEQCIASSAQADHGIATASITQRPQRLQRTNTARPRNSLARVEDLTWT